MIAVTKKRETAVASVRVAIYVRVSVDERVGEEFGSLQAQREAVEAYVKSQRSEGWVALPEAYSDEGFTGANTDRPAFTRLLADIDAGKIDAVAVYKIDRLSRSLLDFTRLMELFRQHGVTFVSVTQQFSTTTAVGRMTLNLLATFAEFEREQISERTRDKMHAARRRGLFIGGWPVLGYDIVERKLVVNADEAERVRQIYRLYLDLGSLLGTVRELNERGWSNKRWTTKAGKSGGGKPFDKTSLRALLRCALYIGKVAFEGQMYDGQHDAILDRETWDAAQLHLTHNHKTAGRDVRNKWGALLKGLARCGVCGAAMTHGYTARGTKRYTYYLCETAAKRGAAACPGSRIKTQILEDFVVDQIRTMGRDPALVAETIAAAKREQEARKPQIAADLRTTEADVKRLTIERTNLVDAVARGTPALGERLVAVDDQLRNLNARAYELRRELIAIDSRVIDESDLRAALESFELVWSELFPREKARILGLLIERVTYDSRAQEGEITFSGIGIKMLAKGKSE